MPRLAVFVFVLLLSGCCSSSVYEKDYACEAKWEKSRVAAGRGWEHVQHGLSPQPHPTLHEGMEASAAEEALGTPPRRVEGESVIRWTYPERGLVVFVEDGKVAGWEQ
jgi:hypothetical protein